MFRFGFIVLIIASITSHAAAQNPVIPGKFIIEPPTLVCLGFEWYIKGDANRNAEVEVRFRKSGQKKWNRGLNLLRIGDERVFNKNVNLEYKCPHMFAGSIFDLLPNTKYECRFTLKDPDGVKGRVIKTVRVKTRAEPKPYKKARILHVYPVDFKGKKKEPAFSGLKEAYHGAGGGDWGVVSENPVKPGDIIEVHAGLYKADFLKYNNEHNIPFHGTYVLTVKGTPKKPITIRAAGDGEAVFDGNGCYRLFDVMAADYHIFEGLTIQNCDIAFYAGLKNVAGCKGLAVKRCVLKDVGMGVLTQFAGSSNFYIADNVMIGRNDTTRLQGWYMVPDKEASRLRSYYGVKVYGPGHVVCRNKISNFHDGIGVCTHGTPEKAQHLKCVSIDFYNNDIFHMCDDFIETDGGVHNIRVFRNRCFNAAQCGLSAQPVFGGPAYFIRNIVYHVPWGLAFKFKAQPAGLIVYHNTVCAENSNSACYSNVHFRNNLILGTDRPEKEVMVVSTNTAYSTFDYNGYRPNKIDRDPFFSRPLEKNKRLDYNIRKRPIRSYKTLKAFTEATGFELHGILVDFDIFRNVPKPDPAQPKRVHALKGVDFRLKEKCGAVDAGCKLPNINDGFKGKAPDLGAYELGAALPSYGPRQEENP